MHDVRYAARLLKRSPRFTLLATLTMALGVGATAILFSVTYGVLLKPLPWPGSDRLVVLKETRGGNSPRFNSFTNAAYLAWQSSSTLEGIAAWSQRTVTLSGRGDPDRIRITAASPSVFLVLGIHPVIGSFFGDKDAVDTPSVVVLSESLWRRRFGADERALGAIVRLDGEPYTILGVVPDEFSFPNRTFLAWIPFRVHPTDGNYLSMFNAVGRLRQGVTPLQAAAEGTARGRFVANTGMTTMAIFGGDGPVAISATAMKKALTTDVRQPLIVLLTAVLLLFLTATANVAALHLARAETRRREMAIRAALGAATPRVVRQLLAESVLLGIIGSAAGVLLASLLHAMLPTVLPADFPRRDDIRFDAVVIALTIVVALGASVVFGLVPAFRVHRLDLTPSLSEDGTASVGASRRGRAGRSRVAIMVGQVAIACVLLVGASLLGRSFYLLVTADRGYDPSGLLTARVSLPASIYSNERRYAIVQSILDRLASNPAIMDAAFTSELPLTAGGSTSAFTLPRPTGAVGVQASPRIVSARVFSALGVRVVAGRGFAESDTESAPPVVVVNRAFARRYLDDRAVGSKLPMAVGYQESAVDATVIGVVDDVRYLSLTDQTQPEMYYSYRQFARRVPVPVVTFLLRTAHDPVRFAGELRTAIRQADPAVVPEAIATMEDRMSTGLSKPRLYALLLGGFALLALLVAGVGLFAVLSQTVAERSREIALRTALGAQRSDIIRLIAGHGLAMTAAGIVIGSALATVLTRSLATILYGVSPHDPATFVAVACVLLFAGLLACLVPARRAMKLDPVRVLRGD